MTNAQEIEQFISSIHNLDASNIAEWETALWDRLHRVTKPIQEDPLVGQLNKALDAIDAERSRRLKHDTIQHRSTD